MRAQTGLLVMGMVVSHSLWSHFCEVAIFIGPNALEIRIASAREPIRLPACLLDFDLYFVLSLVVLCCILINHVTNARNTVVKSKRTKVLTLNK